jgi:hypothetical protein
MAEGKQFKTKTDVGVHLIKTYPAMDGVQTSKNI